MSCPLTGPKPPGHPGSPGHNIQCNLIPRRNIQNERFIANRIRSVTKKCEEEAHGLRKDPGRLKFRRRKIYHYSGCLYPEGLIDPDKLFLFNNEDIERVYYIGMQDEEEFRFRNYVIQKVQENEAHKNTENL